MPDKHSYIIGLTGGIGSGKSTVSQLFSNLGVEIIDADLIAKELVQPNTNALKAIEEHFGQQILDHKGELKRADLRQLIFSDKAEKQWLEALLHPLIRQQINLLITQSKSAYIILSAPLLLESQHYDFVDRVLVIDTPTDLQVERVLKRDNSVKTEVEKIIKSQLSREERLTKADDVIINDQDLAYLKQQVEQLHFSYQQYRKENH